MRLIRAFLVASALAACATAANAAIFLPPDGIELNSIHVDFAWAKDGDPDFYHLEVVIDDGSGDPFLLPTPVVDEMRDGSSHRTVITSGLAFDNDYAWRVRPVTGGTPGTWQPTSRFVTKPLPVYAPVITATTTGMGTYQAGYTLFNIRSPNGTIPSGLALIIDQAGNIVWFVETLDKKITDIRQIDGDRYLYNGSERAWEVMSSGQPAWISPLSDDLRVHHETFQMPNGNVLLNVFDYRQVDVAVEPDPPDLQWWRGDRFVELNRTNNNLAWEWSTWDYYSTLDLDNDEMANPTTGPMEPDGMSYDWTHSNAGIYNPADDSVYVSIRHLSRVTRIDRPSKQVVYNMGMQAPYMPSGDADFGDDLFSFQHSPEMLPNGNMMLYDNGNRRGHVVRTDVDGVTRAIELSFTGNPPTSASIAWEWTLPSYQRAVGDVDRLPGGNTLVVGGMTADIWEVDSAGDIVWHMSLPTGTPDHVIYRAERIDALISGTAPRDNDGDTIADIWDNCPDHENLNQVDRDGDGFGDACARAYGVGVFALPTMSPVGFVLLIGVLVATAFAAVRVSRTA